ncbi:putative multi-domain containing protein [Aduncisulcus paluster]|uniref:Multi-domain containing protein n=1 Tax=Aduncisulcus paluster TaxID=2918883 RepID=A0ABQ5KAV6_9EUKA|nr:putative multi-domain containing protein [Aduncisulcus paluster]|eukprot:gnl/Carplike_NY0171/333_a458_6089.p2 GENE.gnl/Carplike_NY0171/333_a458_6089~~gnl/Carplike_NY0171/333_a458_6089.p2  ORF type:complete len:142 (-),score=46.13 gnl/Carplike_NY0171/333_a458_6089:47-472(-)
MGSGIRNARKLKKHRQVQRWRDQRYKKSHLGDWVKSSPLGGACMAKGIVTDKMGVAAKQPNSAVRKCVRVQLTKNGKCLAAFVPNDGCLNFIDEHDEVIITGMGRKGRACGDRPGIRFKVIKVAGIGLRSLFLGIREKQRA